MELREKILVEINSGLASASAGQGWQWGFDEVALIADRILAIPEIRDALAIIDNRDQTIRDMALEIAELRIKYEPQS